MHPFNNILFTCKKCIIALFYRAYFRILYIISATSLDPKPDTRPLFLRLEDKAILTSKKYRKFKGSRLIFNDGQFYRVLWRELMAIEVYKELLYKTWPKNLSLMAVGREMVRRGYTRDARYISKREWYLKNRKMQ